MSTIPEHYRLALRPAASRDALVQVGNARFTVLTDRLIRLEYHPAGCFEDRASQSFWFREQPVPEFEVRRNGNGVEIETAYLRLDYTGKADAGFTPENLSILLKATGVTWHPGDKDADNLLGTTRTLDFANGYTPLTPGLMSRSGWSVLDDSASLVLNDEGWLEPRVAGGVDLYFLGYGQDFKACLRDYCRVGGGMPLIPRWILGNWWSRFWAYTQDDMVTLIRDFERYELPFSVCIVDMDWHLTKTGNACTGWTGYTWNRGLFPEPEAFIQFAHDRGLKIALNLHPAEGIHDHEEQYADMARCLGIDPASRQPVAFDITNPAFAKAYFEILHHPYERMGVDFWWLDWQQGLKSALPGLDPLWLINHLHFYDLGRDGTRRPFIFSRWGNEGHQRYPIGFSGDSYATWDTLRFETYMTAIAANIAYGWWSHDIGGHISGTEDPELFTRWVQFGVFSPINRLHVTKGEFYDRRPWAFEDAEVLRVLREALQLRHAFVPYLYTMAHRASRESLPLVEPMYYDYPGEDAAYHCPHQYLFGSELIAAPFTSPADKETGLSRQVVWLPKGNWVHFFTGEHYAGNRWYSIYGRLGDIPLFAKAGAIVPLAPRSGWGTVSCPEELHVHVFAGADGSFTLYEDDGETTGYLQGRSCETVLAQHWSGDNLEFTINPASGDTGLIPARRSLTLYIHGIGESVDVDADLDGIPTPLSTTYDEATETLHISGPILGAASSLRLSVCGNGQMVLSRRDRKRETLLRLLKFFRLHTGVRNDLAANLDAIMADPGKIAPYLVTMSPEHARALFEILFEAGMDIIRDTRHPVLLILWNNNADERVTYRYGSAYLHFGFIRSSDFANGPAPRYTKFTPPTDTWRQGSQGEVVHRAQWQAQIDYANLFTVAESYREETP